MLRHSRSRRMSPRSSSATGSRARCTSRCRTTSRRVRPSVLPWTGLPEGAVAGPAVSQRPFKALNRFISYLLVESHLQTQRSAVKMLHERILVLIKYVTDVIAGMFSDTGTTLLSHIISRDRQIRPNHFAVLGCSPGIATCFRKQAL